MTRFLPEGYGSKSGEPHSSPFENNSRGLTSVRPFQRPGGPDGVYLVPSVKLWGEKGEVHISLLTIIHCVLSRFALLRWGLICADRVLRCPVCSPCCFRVLFTSRPCIRASRDSIRPCDSPVTSVTAKITARLCTCSGS